MLHSRAVLGPYGQSNGPVRASPPIEECAAGALFDSPLCCQKRKLGTKSPETAPTTPRLTTISDPEFRLWPAWPPDINLYNAYLEELATSQHVAFRMHVRTHAGLLFAESETVIANSVSCRSHKPGMLWSPLGVYPSPLVRA